MTALIYIYNLRMLKRVLHEKMLVRIRNHIPAGSLDLTLHPRESGFFYYPRIRREIFVPERHCFRTASFEISLRRVLVSAHTFPATEMYRSHFFRTAIPWRPCLAFLFAVPIKFVLVSRVMQVTIYRRNKKTELYAFTGASIRVGAISTCGIQTKK